MHQHSEDISSQSGIWFGVRSLDHKPDLAKGGVFGSASLLFGFPSPHYPTEKSYQCTRLGQLALVCKARSLLCLECCVPGSFGTVPADPHPCRTRRCPPNETVFPYSQNCTDGCQQPDGSQNVMTLVIPSIETHACVREGFEATGDGGFTGKELHEVYWRPIGQSTPLDFEDVW